MKDNYANIMKDWMSPSIFTKKKRKKKRNNRHNDPTQIAKVINLIINQIFGYEWQFHNELFSAILLLNWEFHFKILRKLRGRVYSIRMPAISTKNVANDLYVDRFWNKTIYYRQLILTGNFHLLMLNSIVDVCCPFPGPLVYAWQL